MVQGRDCSVLVDQSVPLHGVASEIADLLLDGHAARLEIVGRGKQAEVEVGGYDAPDHEWACSENDCAGPGADTECPLFLHHLAGPRCGSRRHYRHMALVWVFWWEAL